MCGRGVESSAFSFTIMSTFLCLFTLFSDLSNNRIGCLTGDMFQGLTNLTKL